MLHSNESVKIHMFRAQMGGVWQVAELGLISPPALNSKATKTPVDFTPGVLKRDTLMFHVAAAKAHEVVTRHLHGACS